MDQRSEDPLPAAVRLAVAGYVVDLGNEELLDSQGDAVELRPKAWQVLRHLVLNAGRIVTKEELLAAVWPRLVVTDDSLVQAVGDIRRALGAAGHRVVRTVPRRGYLLVADAVRPVLATPWQPAPRPARRLAGRPRLAMVGVALLVGCLVAALWLNSPWSGAGGKTSERPSIAVLEFTDPEHGTDGQMLARSVAEDLVTELARGPDLRVVSHQSSFRFASNATAPAEIGRRLRSRYLVDGRVRREGEQLRIVVELLDSIEGHVVWSSAQRVDRETLQAAREALVSRIAGTLQTKVRNTEEHRALQRPPKTLDVVVLTEHGKASMLRYSAQGMRDARRFYGEALARDPEHAPAWVLLGIANTVDIGLHLTGEWPAERIGEVLAQIQKAIALDPRSPTAYAALSQAQAIARDFNAALASAERCFEVSPNEADCFYILGKAQLELGDAQSASRNLAAALDRNPLPPAYLPAFYATALWGSRRFEEAIRSAEDCLGKAPDFWRCRIDRIAALVELGRLAEARADAGRLLAQVPGMTTDRFGQQFADGAVELRSRRIDAGHAAGIPLGAITIRARAADVRK